MNFNLKEVFTAFMILFAVIDIIGTNGIQIIRKIFGVILLAISVKLFAQNIKMLFV